MIIKILGVFIITLAAMVLIAKSANKKWYIRMAIFITNLALTVLFIEGMEQCLK